ncbi:MAG: glycosyltransferase [Deltaproteobacteria bacterium]|nr:glycosyltransferase [Deltaproteobacteria bacterium]
MQIALVHDWLNGMRGGEKCLEQVCELFPTADVFTLIHEPGQVSPTIESHSIRTSFLQRLPGRRRFYRHFLPLFPTAIERLDLRGYDFVVSLSHCVAKGARVEAGTPHLCYCFTPMRYAWDLEGEYFSRERSSAPVRWAAARVLPYLRRWDVASSARVTRFVAISEHVRERVRRIYGRDAGMIYPPVDTEAFRPDTAPPQREDFYLMVTALAPYKGVDVAIEAFRGTGRRLVVIGKGQDERRLRAVAGPEVTFLGWVDAATLRDAYARCRAFLHPADEDFGIAPVEAQAMGTPVIGHARGGLLETVRDLAGAGRDEPTGVLFEPLTPDALRDAIDRFEAARGAFGAEAIRRHAQRFSTQVFRDEFAALVRSMTTGGGVPSASAPSRVAPSC